MKIGIDISKYSNMDWIKTFDDVKGKSLYFAFIKASEGQTLKDPKFTTYWDKCRSAGLLCGAYHFLRPKVSASVQAQNFLSQYKLVNQIGALPPVVDIEWAYSSTDTTDQWLSIPANQRIPMIKTFLSALEEELHVKPIIYTANVFWRDTIANQFSSTDKAYFNEYPLWLVDLKGNSPVPSPWTNAAFIQNHFGEKAIDKTNPFDILDQDYFKGSTKALLNIAHPSLTIFKGQPKSMLICDIQEALKNKGFYTSTVDGGFGNISEAAVKTFQEKNNLTPTGIVDSQTWNKLLD